MKVFLYNVKKIEVYPYNEGKCFSHIDNNFLG